jgi:hypothetical protein
MAPVKKSVKRKSAAAGRSGSLRVEGKRIPTVGKGLLLVRTKAAEPVSISTRPSDEAKVAVIKVGQALSKPGIDKQRVVFKSHMRTDAGIFAYSIYPDDTTKVVREAADGTRRVGRLVGGKFKAT